MPELDEDPGTAHYARVTPLGLEPADAVYTAQLNQNVIDMLMTKVESQAAEIARWQVVYRLVFEENERRGAVVEELERYIQARSEPDETPLGEQIDGGSEVPA